MDAIMPAGLRCHGCGTDRIIAVAPGHEASRFGDLFLIERGIDVRGWCLRCWPTTKQEAVR